MPAVSTTGRARISPLGLLFLAVASIGWGLNFPIMKHLLSEWPPLSSRGLCGFVGAAALALIAIVIGGDGVDASLGNLPGLILALVGAVSVALGTVLTKHFPLSMPPLSLAAWQIGIGCLPVAIVGLAVEQPQLAALSAIGWASMAYMTLIQFCLCYVCWFATLERLPAATASIGTLLVPVVGVVSAAVMLHEPFGLREFAALAVALSGVAVALRA